MSTSWTGFWNVATLQRCQNIVSILVTKVANIHICRHFLFLFQNCWFFKWFLSLLDYVSGAHEIKICRSFVMRPDFFQILVVASPGHYARTFFEFVKKKYIVTNIFVFVNMGPHGSEHFKTLLLLEITAKSFQLVLNFPPNGPHKNKFGIFEINSFQFLTISFRKLQIHHCRQKPQVSGKRAIVEQNGVKFENLG